MPTLHATSHFSQFNLNHWLAVKAVRIEQGLDADRARAEELIHPDHPLVGRVVFDHDSGQHGRVLEVRRSMLQGAACLTAVMATNTGKLVRVIDSLSHPSPQVAAAAQQFQVAPSFA